MFENKMARKLNQRPPSSGSKDLMFVSCQNELLSQKKRTSSPKLMAEKRSNSKGQENFSNNRRTLAQGISSSGYLGAENKRVLSGKRSAGQSLGRLYAEKRTSSAANGMQSNKFVSNHGNGALGAKGRQSLQHSKTLEKDHPLLA